LIRRCDRIPNDLDQFPVMGVGVMSSL
jgi:hypothetical protein